MALEMFYNKSKNKSVGFPNKLGSISSLMIVPEGAMLAEKRIVTIITA